MSESSGVLTCGQAESNVIGSVGKPYPGVEIRLSKVDGEIQTHGPHIFMDYFKDQKSTQEAITEAWFNTGDIGEITDQGDLKILGRKKKLLKMLKAK